MLKVFLRELVGPQRSGLQRVRLQNAGFTQPPPEMEPVQLGAWEGVKIPQTQQEGWLVSRVEVGEKYPLLLTIFCVLLMADHWEQMSGGASGAPLAVWVMKAGRNPCDGAVEHRAVLSPAKDCC